MYNRLKYTFDKPERARGVAVHNNTYTIGTWFGPEKRYRYLFYKQRGKGPSGIVTYKTRIHSYDNPQSKITNPKDTVYWSIAPKMNVDTGKQVSETIVVNETSYNLPLYMADEVFSADPVQAH